MEPDFGAKLDEIRRLLAEAYEHYFEYGDGHCKSSEGAISVHFQPFFWREKDPHDYSIEVYSYVLGPNRSHFFTSVDEALATVREWCSRELAFDYSEVWT